MTRSHHPNHIDYVEFPFASVDSLAQAQTFFSEVFGWAYNNWGDYYADTGGSGIGNGLSADPLAPSGKPLVVIYTDNIDAMREKILVAGGKITRDTFFFPGGKRFHFREPGGTELAVWSDK